MHLSSSIFIPLILWGKIASLFRALPVKLLVNNHANDFDLIARMAVGRFAKEEGPETNHPHLGI